MKVSRRGLFKDAGVFLLGATLGGLSSQLPKGVATANTGKQEAIEMKNIRSVIRQTVEDIHYINLKNLALIKNGQMYVETLLNSIWPSLTYEREKTGCFAPPSRFSMEC